MTLDLAVSYLDMHDLDNARRTYQHIVDHQRHFAHIWANELGKAYLFTNDSAKAMATLEQSEVLSYDQGLFLAIGERLVRKQNPQSSKQNSRPSQQIEESFLSCGSKSFCLKFARCCS